MLAAEVVAMTAVRRAGVVPVVDAERALAGARVVVMGNRVRQTARPHLVRAPLRVQRRLDAVLLEEEREVKAGGAGTDDSDLRHG